MIYMIARALKAGGSADRAELNKQLTKEAVSGFDGTQGKLTSNKGAQGGYDLRVKGILVGWDGTTASEMLIK